MATFTVGQRVAILVGAQAADGPSVGSYGTVTAVTEFWRGQFDYTVAPEDGSEALVYPAYLLQNAQEDAASDYAARARSMAAHPAGKGWITLTVTNHHTGETFPERIMAGRAGARMQWYRDRAVLLPTLDGGPGWTVTR